MNKQQLVSKLEAREIFQLQSDNRTYYKYEPPVNNDKNDHGVIYRSHHKNFDIYAHEVNVKEITPTRLRCYTSVLGKSIEAFIYLKDIVFPGDFKFNIDLARYYTPDVAKWETRTRLFEMASLGFEEYGNALTFGYMGFPSSIVIEQVWNLPSREWRQIIEEVEKCIKYHNNKKQRAMH